jgi:hypothetical protein
VPGIMVAVPVPFGRVDPLTSLIPISTQQLRHLLLQEGLDPLLYLAGSGPKPKTPPSKLLTLPAFLCSYIPWRCSPSFGADARPRILVLGRVHRLSHSYTLFEGSSSKRGKKAFPLLPDREPSRPSISTSPDPTPFPGRRSSILP